MVAGSNCCGETDNRGRMLLKGISGEPKGSDGDHRRESGRPANRCRSHIARGKHTLCRYDEIQRSCERAVVARRRATCEEPTGVRSRSTSGVNGTPRQHLGIAAGTDAIEGCRQAAADHQFQGPTTVSTDRIHRCLLCGKSATHAGSYRRRSLPLCGSVLS